MNPEKKGLSEVKDKVRTNTVTNTDLAKIKNPVYEKFVETTVDENGIFNGITYKNTEKFNFAYDIVDEMARKNPSKTAMVYLSELKEARRFTFKEMSEYSNQTANYFKSLGIGKGDKVLVVLKRHYQFWFTILALHKIGAIIIPATHLLKDHDFEYRFNAAHCKAIVCTGTGD
ncbi:MAG: AMP-binding protein, partial [Lachnospiraceae bacterium]|nr:AMP-binding protein [Lachnospiraceae bacterium]